MRIILSIFSLILAFSTASNAQDQQRFKAGVIAGVTASQIDGDLSAGYNKLGLQAGLRTEILLKPKFTASVELLFAQRGAQSELIPSTTNFNFSLTTNYVEIPLQIHLKDWLVEDKNNISYYKANLNTGFSYGRLIGTSVKDDLSAVDRYRPFLAKNDASFLIGATFWANRHAGFTVRYVRSLTWLYNPKKHSSPIGETGWNSHELYFQFIYAF